MRNPVPLFLAIAVPLCAQNLIVSPKPLKLVQVEGGPVAISTLTIAARDGGSIPFTATASAGDDPWLVVTAAGGTTPAKLGIGVVGWRGEQRPPGTWKGQVTIKGAGINEVIPVEWEVRPASRPPAFTYNAGPNNCSTAPGYADAAYCTQLPIPGIAGAPATGTSYIDPNFGSRVRVATGPNVYHNYSTPSPLSAHNKYLLTYPSNGTYDLTDAATGRTVAQRVPSTQSYFWDATDDEVYYYFQGGSSIVKYDIRLRKGTILIDYATQPQHFHEILHGGTGDTSKDNWISFWAPDEKQVCALDIDHLKTYCADYSASQRKLPYGDIDFTLISKGVDRATGKRYVMMVAPPAMGVFSVDTARGNLRPEFRGGENVEKPGNHDGVCDPGERCLVGAHVDTLEDSAGVQYLVLNADTSSPCEFAINTYQLNKGADMVKQVELGGGRKKVMTLWRCGPGWVDEHVGCAKAAPYCVISTQGVPHGRYDPTPPVTPHGGEILVMRENGAEIRRIALSRSVLFTDAADEGYWSTPRAAISGDGSLVAADSNFGVPSGQRVTLIETGFKK